MDCREESVLIMCLVICPTLLRMDLLETSCSRSLAYFENFSKSQNIFVLNNYITAVVVVGFTTGIWLHWGVIFKASLGDNFNSSTS